MQKEAKELAINRAIDKLKEKDIRVHLANLSFKIENDKRLHFRYFDKIVEFDLDNLELINQDGVEISLNEKVLFYHFILNDRIPVNTDKQISFRELPAGQFYDKPFQERSVNILSSKIGNDIDRLVKNLDAFFEWGRVPMADFGAKITIIQDVYIILVYYLGDEEFASSAQVLFDESIKHIFSAEDVVVLTSLVCFKLIG